ncbi:MAG: hypothetical protein ACOC0N_06655 [Chroococcales cyanobacterium]
MRFFSKPIFFFPLLALISLITASCGNPTTTQCREIITIANETVNQARTVTQGGQTNDPQAILQAADMMEQAAQDLEAIAVEDEQLQSYKEGFIAMYQDTSTATRNFVEAYEQKNREAAEEALTNLQEAMKPEQELVTGINNYCNQ